MLPKPSSVLTVAMTTCQTKEVVPLFPSHRKPRDFSISAILSNFGPTTSSADEENECNTPDEIVDETQCGLEWLRYTRYAPPKLPRLKRNDSVRKRRLGRNPRVPFSNVQVAVLETRFRMTQYVSGNDVMELAAVLGLTENRVKIWFQNRRARERREKIACLPNNANVSFVPLTLGLTNYGNDHYPQFQPLKTVQLTPSPSSAFHTVSPATLYCSSITTKR